jgi:uncharacterized integral membrane protein
MSVRLIFSLVLIGVSILFVLQNTDVAHLRFLFWSLSMSAALLYLLLLISGAIIGWLLRSYALHRKRAAKNR